jgi:hypothetical protein
MEIEFFRMKLWVRLLYMCFPLVGLFLWNAGIGVSDEHLILKGFTTKKIPWGDIESLTQGSTSLLGGAAGALLTSLVLRPLLLTQKGRFGALTVPVHQTENPQQLLTAITARLDAVKK